MINSFKIGGSILNSRERVMAVFTQRTLPFGTPEMISKEVKHNMKCLKPGGGFIA
ncbi:MAG: hypothetical protein ACFFG0_23760 [Candidatus Thorarchaeota archaeon]